MIAMSDVLQGCGVVYKDWTNENAASVGARAGTLRRSEESKAFF